MAQEQVSKIEYWEGKIAREIFASLEEKKKTHFISTSVPYPASDGALTTM